MENNFPPRPSEAFFRSSSSSLLNLWKASQIQELQDLADDAERIVEEEETTTTLLLVDVQNDFHPGGSLAIPTATEDAQRIAKMIRSSELDRIVCTMDSHHPLHIAHPEFWWDGQDHMTHPTPFTTITTADIESGKWKPRTDLNLTGFPVDPEIFGTVESILKEDGEGGLDLYKYCLEYAKRLEACGRFQLTIWPPHCLMGSVGHGLVDVVQEALVDWSRKTGKTVEYVLKGSHLLTEMYSALAADVPVSTDTDLNGELVDSLLNRTSRLVVAGQAMSHCVNYTVRDLVDAVPDASRITVLTDCASAVPGFEDAAKKFLDDMKEKGVLLQTSIDLVKM